MKVTKIHLELYKKWVIKWINVFKIGGWEVRFEINETDRENLAGSKWNLMGKTCTFELNNGWNKLSPLTEENIRISALHEVLHLCMAKLVTVANRRYVNKDQVEEAQEEAVNILLNYIKENE